MPALGDRFREARESRGLTLSEVAEQIRIRSVYLAAIEDENWPAIGAPIYVRGFLRTYARFLGLNPEEAVAAFNLAMGDRENFEPSPAAPSYPETEGERRNIAPLLWVACTIAALLIAYVVYSAIGLRNRTPSPVASVMTPESSTTPSSGNLGPIRDIGPPNLTSPSPLVPTTADEAHALSIVTTAPTWLRVTVDGKVLYEGVLRTGSRQTFQGRTAAVRIGNAGGAQITVDGTSLGVLGAPGQIVDRTFSL